MRIGPAQAESIFRDYLDQGLIDGNKAVIFYVKEVLDHRLGLLEDHFPSDTLHAVAVKTCNHPDVLNHIVKKGHGLEAASLEEVLLAKEAGAENEKIVFDSPVKTRQEIQYCHKELPGILVNANSLQELKRFPAAFNGRLGLRINPLTTGDGPDMLNVSTRRSKFGVPITSREDILKAALAHPQLIALHMHIGSGISDFRANLEAVDKIVELARDINRRRSEQGIGKRIQIIDIGGGIEFDVDNGPFTVPEFIKGLQKIPALFADFKLVTEYGKFIHKHCSFATSKIEYVLEGQDEQPAMAYIHIGADLFVRKIYSSLPTDYPVSVIHKYDRSKRGSKYYTIAGPLCFAGDIVFQKLELPELEEGDTLIIHDIGANTYSMWSEHCNREKPPFFFVE